jgi:hypothetical protein
LSGDDVAGASVCSAKFVDPSLAAERVFVWLFEVKLVSVVADRTTLRVHWTRSRDVGGQPELERDDVRTITLGPADSHVLDYVEDPGDPPSSCASLLVRISAEPIQQQNARSLAVDVWTVDESSAGETRSVHQRIEGPSGEPLAYHLPPLEFAPAGVGAAEQPVSMNVHGTFQAVVSEDGFLDVNLSAVRRTSSPKGDIQGEGRIKFRAKIGETAAVLLPEPAGNLPLASPTADRLDLRRFFSGHRTSLYVKVESVR